MDNATGFVVQHYGQVAVALSNRYFIDGQDAKSIIVYLAILDFQILFVNFLDRFPIQLKMPGHLGDRHHFAELMDISCQSPGNPQIRVKKLQFLDTDAPAMGAKQFAICTAQPDLSTGKVQIPNRTVSPAVNCWYFLSTLMTDRLKTLVGSQIDMSSVGGLIDCLFDNFYSTKGKI
jgi:hypothetical protein